MREKANEYVGISILDYWPEFSDESDQYNSNLDKFRVICDALLRNVLAE